MVGNTLWEDNFSSLLDLLRSIIVDVWQLKKAIKMKIARIRQSQSHIFSGELGGGGDGGRFF